MTTPLLGITLGDVAGIGPEIIVGAWPEITCKTQCRAIVYGHSEILRRAARLLNQTVQVCEIASPDRYPPSCPTNVIPCIQCCEDKVLKVSPCTVDRWAGEAAYRAIVAATDDAKAHRIDGIVTAPIHKEALNLAGYAYPGHTEILASRCNVDDFAMMLYLGVGHPLVGPDGLAVVHVTLHTAMRNIFDLITVESVLAKTKLAHGFMDRIIGHREQRPRIGVCSLNPHAGEGGLFGREEMEIIRPAVETAVERGLCVEGPLPADTIMIAAKNGHYDAVVAMFHDQGHIALKLLGMNRAVNITLGLPIIRTSVAHGTAMDKAWKGTAETGSMVEAVRVAAKMASL